MVMACASQNLGFDDYAEAIQGARLLYLKTGPTTAPWKLAWHLINRVTLQFGADGSARIIHGVTSSDDFVFIIQSSKLPNCVFLDGQLMQWHEMAVFPPSSQFTFVCDVPVEWISLSLPEELANALQIENGLDASLLTRKKIIKLSQTGAAQFANKSKKVRASIHKNSRLKTEVDTEATEAVLIQILNNAIADRIGEKYLPDRYTEASEETVFKALAYVQSKMSDQIYVEELVDVTGVEYRTLLRAFQRYLKVGPKRYLKLRQLNLARRALRGNHLSSTGVTNILAEHGVTEFGRFASEYKYLFDEAPSDTFQKDKNVRETARKRTNFVTGD